MTRHAGQAPPPSNNEDSGKDATAKDEPVSLVLQSILASQGISHREFFERIWQNQPYLLRTVSESCQGSQLQRCYYPREAALGGNGLWRDDRMKTTPWNEMVHQGWKILSAILETAGSDGNDEHEVPLILRNLEVMPRDEALAWYGTSLFSSYLDGCSVVLNHADLLSPYIAALCEDLQCSFPHAYANCYLTPPDSQAVPPHADDRDVLVFQLVGSKDWQVYQTVPIPYPYPNEQVGKAGMPVPPPVLDGPVALSVRLEPGDVLYMPRGMVHQARSTPDRPSFHITVALATHDWTLAGNLGRAIQKRLNEVVDFRRSLLPMAAPADLSSIQKNIDEALERIRLEVTATSILKDMEGRIGNHNNRAFSRRAGRIHQARMDAFNHDGGMRPAREERNGHDVMDGVVGPGAAKAVTYGSIIRASSSAERMHAQKRLATTGTPPPGGGMPITTAAPEYVPPRGLHVREAIGDAIMEIVSKVKADATRSYRVVDLRRLMDAPNVLVCDLSLLSLAKSAVELGAFAVAVTNDDDDDDDETSMR